MADHSSESDRFGENPIPWATVEGLRGGVVNWAHNKKVEQGGPSIYSD
jgi:hypothetical protein